MRTVAALADSVLPPFPDLLVAWRHPSPGHPCFPCRSCLSHPSCPCFCRLCLSLSLFLCCPFLVLSFLSSQNDLCSSQTEVGCSLLYMVFKPALCYSVVSGCFVHAASPSPSIRPEPAPKRGLRGSGLAFRRPESARKVHAKSFGP